MKEIIYWTFLTNWRSKKIVNYSRTLCSPVIRINRHYIQMQCKHKTQEAMSNLTFEWKKESLLFAEYFKHYVFIYGVVFQYIYTHKVMCLRYFLPKLKLYYKTAVWKYSRLYHRQWSLYFSTRPFLPAQHMNVPQSDLPPVTCLSDCSKITWVHSWLLFLRCQNLPPGGLSWSCCRERWRTQ